MGKKVSKKKLYRLRREMKRLRKYVLGIYNNECHECGSIENLQVHHMLKLAHGGKNNIENLVVLCRECHRKAHKKPDKSGFLKPLYRKKNYFKGSLQGLLIIENTDI